MTFAGICGKLSGGSPRGPKGGILSRQVAAGLIACAALLLLLPALWNGFPFIFYDSGDYLAVTLTGQRVVYRDPIYGYVAAVLHGRHTLWGVAVGQSLLSAWILWEVVGQMFHERGRAAAFLAVTALLAVGSSLPWFSAQVMPDIWGALAVLMVALLALTDLPAWKRAALALLLAVALACHLSFLPLGAGLLLLLLGLRIVLIRKGLVVRLGWTAIAVAVAPSLIVAANLSLGGPAALSQTSHAFLLARMMQDGLAKRTLDRLCPDPTLKLCALKDRLPTSANDFLWSDSEAFALVGGWLDSREEANRIIAASFDLFPAEHVVSAVKLSVQQLIWFSTGDGLESQAEPWGVIEAHLPRDFPSYEAARQQTGLLPLRSINDIHVPLAALAMLSLPLLLWAAWRSRRWRGAAALVLIGGALLGNAVICGVLSNPNDRYESRVVWLAVFALGLAAAEAVRKRLPSSISKDRPAAQDPPELSAR